MASFNFLNKFDNLFFLLRKPSVIIFVGGNRKISKEVLLHILRKYPKVKKNLLLLESNLDNTEELKFFIKNSSFPLLVITNNQNVSLEKIKIISKENPGRGFLISNFDEEQNRELKTETLLRVLYFGFQSGADFQATDTKISRSESSAGDEDSRPRLDLRPPKADSVEETNFKINYKGNIVPIWLKNISKETVKTYIYSVLISAAIGEVLGLNLVEISEALKDFQIKG